jgi:DNA-binding transcriptional LysR family regulator
MISRHRSNFLNMPITLESLAVIDAIARRGSFAAAAAELGRVPSALTYTVRRLEDELDALLFDRRGRRARLTPAGQELLQQGRALLRAADDLACRVREVASGWEVELRIALDAMVSFDRVRPMLDDFYRLGSPTRLRFSAEVLDGSWDALLSGRAELAIGVGHDAPSAVFAAGQFSSRPLGEMPFVYCVAPHHPLAGAQQPVPPEVLVGHRAVAVANTARALPARSAGLLSGQDLLTVATLEQKIAMQVAGVGCGFLPEPFARPHLAAGRLVALQLAQPQAPAVLRYAWRTGTRSKALAWWLHRLEVPRVRAMLLAGPVTAASAGETRAAPARRAAARKAR